MFEYRGLKADIIYSDDDKLYVGQVLDIEDYVAFHGESLEEAIEIFHQAVDNYLAFKEKRTGINVV